MSKHENAPTAADFEAYTKEDERKALAEIAHMADVKTMIKGSEFWALAPDGNIYKLPMLLTIKQFQQLAGADDVQSVDMVVDMVRAFAGEKDAEKLLRAPIQVISQILDKYGAAIVKTQGADLGKLEDSPRSSTAPSMAD